MKIKMKGKAEGKAIIGIALAAIMLASVFAAMAPTGSAEPFPPESYSGLYNYITLANNPPATPVLIGQDIWFQGDTNASATIQGDPASGNVAGENFTADPQGKFDTSVMTKTGIYYVNPIISGTTVTSWDAKLAVTNPMMSMDLKSGVASVSSITPGTLLEVDFTNNLGASDMVSLVITDPDGNTIKSTTTPTQYFDKINVSYLTSRYGVGAGVNTTGWKLGTYKFKVMTEKNTTMGRGAQGLEAESNEKKLTIITGEISITTEKTSAAELESITLTVTGVKGRSITISNSDNTHTIFPGGKNDNPSTDTSTTFSDTIDADGKRVYTVYFNDTGLYAITVTDTVMAEKDTVYITVTEKEVTFDLPTTVAIGERLTIKGTANTGDWVQIAVDNVICNELKKLVLDENGEFEKEIDTTLACSGAFSVPGYVRLKAFIDTSYASGQDVSDKTDDGSIKVFMVRPWLTASLSTDSVDLGDKFTISGIAEGSKYVNILVVAPKGSSGTKIDGTSKGMYGTSTSVSIVDGTFSKRIRVGEDVDMGSYLVAVLSPGADGRYGKVGWATLDEALSCYSLAARTQDEILEILDDIVSLSDDLVCVGYIKTGWIEILTLNPIPDVVVGNPLEVTGKTSRKEGSIIWITVKGRYYEIVPQAAIVKDNTFNATFDTTSAQPGIYIVKAIDGYGYTAATTVNIIAETPPAPTSFDTGEGTYPSIMGTHNGTIMIQRA